MAAGPDAGSDLAAKPDPAAAELPFDPAEFESRLAWILGSPRTGSSWLLRLLVHPWRLGRYDVARARISLRRRGPRKHEKGVVVPINETFFPRHLTPFQQRADVDGRPPEPDDLLFNSQNAGWVNYCFADAYEDVWRPELRRLVLVRLHAQVARAEQEFELEAPLVAIKEPNGSYGAEFLMSLVPRAKMIFLYRDGRDVVDSQLALRTETGARRRGTTPISGEEERLAFVRSHARLWVNNMTAVERAYDRHDPTLRMRLRYEDLLGDTYASLRPLIEWLGSDRSDEQVRKAVENNAFDAVPRIVRGEGRWRRAATPGLWRENLTAAEQRIATDVMGEKLASLGYPT